MKRFETRVDPVTGERYLAVFARGRALKDDPVLNKGTCFTREERDALGLAGLLPPAIQTPDEQLARAYGNYLAAGDDVRRYLFLAGLQDRNESLFCRLVLEHLDEMVPVIYTPTVGRACEEYSHIYRRSRGMYISPRHRGRIASVLANAVAEPGIIVVTDNEAILGIGDQGVGGMPIAIGKLALYTVAAGIHPAACLPLDLDVGTENPARLADPLYLGIHERRLRGESYFSLLDELVDAIGRVFPRALVQWEDFANENAFAVLDRYRRRVLSFDDDIQGTGAVVVAGILSALKAVGRRFEDERIVFLGAGAAGAGSALAVRAALRELGLTALDIGRRVVCLDSRGLIVTTRPGLAGAKGRVAVDPALAADWPRAADGGWHLGEVIRGFRPTVLVGASGQAGAFTREIVADLQAGCPRPIVLALSNPNSRCEVLPEELIRWTRGAAVVGTGSPFAPVSYEGTSYRIGLGNNALIFPGVGLGATAVEATWLPDEAFAAAARALVSVTPAPGRDGSPIYPPLTELRAVARAVAEAVGTSLVESGAAPPRSPEQVRRRVRDAMWDPAYLPYRPAEHVATPVAATTVSSQPAG